MGTRTYLSVPKDRGDHSPILQGFSSAKAVLGRETQLVILEIVEEAIQDVYGLCLRL